MPDDSKSLVPADLTEKQLEEAEAAVGSATTDALKQTRNKLPLLKLAQGLTRENIEDGHFFNSLTTKDYGPNAELIIVFSCTGRFFSDRKSGESYSALTDVAPNWWPDKYAGQRFDELPDAEETFRERVNSGDLDEWGSGPPIRTTRNFIGFVPEDPAIPVRLSLMRTSAPAADKIEAIIKWSLKQVWHSVIDLASKRETDSQDNPYYIVTATQGRKATVDERKNALSMYQQVEGALGTLLLDSGEDARAEKDKARASAAAGADPEALDVT